MQRMTSLNRIDDFTDDISKSETPRELRRDSDPMHRLKRIGILGSFALMTNNITGPGMISIPPLFQQAGWVIPTALFIVCGIWSAWVSLYLTKALQMVRNNRTFSVGIEFGNVAKMLLPRWAYLLMLTTLIFNFQASNVSSIIISAQAMDSTLIEIFGKTCAIVLYEPTRHGNGTFHNVWSCVTQGSLQDSSFGDAYVISMGFVVVLAITIPVGFFNLDDNIWLQVGGLAVLFVCVVLWTAVFFEQGLEPSRMPAFGNQFGSVLSVVIFNFGYVTTLPSWLNEKKPEVSIQKSIWTAVSIAVALFLWLGIFGGLGLNYGGSDLLAAVDALGSSALYAKVGTYMFPPAALLTSIPVFSIIIRYNLIENQICGTIPANLFSVVLPWVVALFFYPGSLIQDLMNWSSALIFVELNFFMPMILYVYMARRRRLYDVGCTAPPSFQDPRRHVVVPPGEEKPLINGVASVPRYVLEREGSVYGGDDEIVGDSHMHVLPAWLRRCMTETTMAWYLVWLGAIVCLITLILQAVYPDAS